MTEKKEDPSWLAAAKATHAFHINQVKLFPKWNITKTAEHLKQSVGLTSEQLTIAQWMKTHSSQLEEFSYHKDAIEFIRARKHKLLTEDI